MINVLKLYSRVVSPNCSARIVYYKDDKYHTRTCEELRKFDLDSYAKKNLKKLTITNPPWSVRITFVSVSTAEEGGLEFVLNA